jgi:hypothetical protein
MSNYTIGQKIAVSYSGHGHRPNRYKFGEVVRVSKTRVTVRTVVMVEGAPTANDESFSILSGQRIGDKGSYFGAHLETIERAEQGQAFYRQRAADENRRYYRQQMAEKLATAARSDSEFRALLAELNSREYVA